MVTIYGLKNCDTCRKALKAFNDDAIPYAFVDFNKDVIDTDTLAKMIASSDKATFINRRSTTWRTLDDAQKTALENGDVTMFMAYLSVIKRPVFYDGNRVMNGFSPAIYEQLKSE